MTEQPGTMFDYFKVIVENFSIWPLLAIAALIWIGRHPEFLERLSRFKLGGLEVELEKLQNEVRESREEIAVLENELSQQEKRVRAILNNFDEHVPVPELEETRQALKAEARNLDDMDVVKHWLRDGATSAEIYAAAVALRERPMPSLFPDTINCLKRLAEDDNLLGVRLHFVWTLTSAVHKILITDMKHSAESSISKKHLNDAKEILLVLEKNPRVQEDRPDAPKAGIRGPLGHALTWIEKGLK
ncbi:hypothetical protein [Sneathiella aquimaris]|uniref:hypothetical protein n=1 Tax=Sneathiella aquimaris TaxID=2599305 RepID=UPI00146D6CD3|nr:hypothetical protein [Sneathiella aquimaris]